VTAGTKVGVRLGGALRVFTVASSQPALAVVHAATAVESRAAAAELPVLAGVDRALAQLVAMVRACRDDGDGVQPARGALVYGPSGVGKTLLARAVARAVGGRVVVVEPGSPHAQQQLQAALGGGGGGGGGALVVIDDADVLCPARAHASDAASRHLVSALLALLDDGAARRTFCLACARRPELMDAALRRPGRLDEEIELCVPDADARAAILAAHLARYPHAVADVRAVAAKAHGFVGADLAAAVRAAAQACVREGAVSQSALQAAVARTSPSALRQVAVEVPDVRWSDIGGMQAAKRVLRQAVELPLAQPEAFARLGVAPPAGVLLYGPPGCSKTLMAKAVATESEMNFVAVKGPELLSKWVGESEKAVQETFRRARASAPCVVFFDEVDALAGRRDDAAAGVEARVLSQLLLELDGVQARGHVVVLCATNRPDLLDPALLRPGRLDRLVYVPPPDAEARRAILRLHLRAVPLDCAPDALDDVDTKGFSGAEVAAVAREAALLAMDRGARAVALDDVVSAARAVKPQITRDMLDFYEGFAARQRSA